MKRELTMTERVYEHVLDMFSDENNPTPMVRLNKVHPFEHTQVYAKLEWYNPFGAVKDRVAANLLRDGEARGLVREHQRLVEPTSGNTGMGLAMLANLKGYELTTPLSTEIPAEKRVMLKFAGAQVEELQDTLCPAPGAPEGAIARAMELAERDDFHMLNQYQNEANFEAHIQTTGPEIWRQTQGEITHFASAMGTCGTLTGNGRYLKSQNPNVQVIGAHPNEGHDIPGVRSLRQLQQTQLFRPSEYDGLVEIHNDDAYAMCLRLNREEGIIAGPSAALGLLGALARVEDKPGNKVVVIFADNIYKYASSFERHFPDFQVAGSSSAPAEPSPKERYFERMVAHTKAGHGTVEIDQLNAMLGTQDEPLIVDVRAADVYAKAHLPGAVNIPLESMDSAQDELPHGQDQPIVTVCNRGVMSLSGLLLLQSMGYRSVKSLNGGTIGWQEAGLTTNNVDRALVGS
jgi:cysteine synthase/rhodanese-related sulfurtransferase